MEGERGAHESSSYPVTPKKINMEPENHPFRKENHLHTLHF